MSIKESYNKWADQYDSNVNKTRDMEGEKLKLILAQHVINNAWQSVLEIGCGTGKNTEWFVKHFEHVTSADFSEEMLAVAKAKINAVNVEFVCTDIIQPWTFLKQSYELVSFSLILEHIKNLEHIFQQANNALKDGGYLYIGELHPFKQYSGSKARFETTEGTETLISYTHHTSEFVNTAIKFGLQLIQIEEHFDEEDESGIPRILTLLFQKK